LLKRKLDVSLVSWSAGEVDDALLEEIDPDSDGSEGTLTVYFTPGGKEYSWYCTYEKYQEFEAMKTLRLNMSVIEVGLTVERPKPAGPLLRVDNESKTCYNMSIHSPRV